MSNLLYKYLDVNGAIMMLDYSNLMYANATMFNDPFDCHPSLIDFSNVPIEARRGWPANFIEEMESNRHTNYRNDLWICSLSKVYNSILMWSYYNKHEGVCIGLNMDKVAKCIDVRYGMMVTSQARSVQYKDVVNKPNYYRDREDFFNYQVYTKAKAWEHEQEMRLFIYKPSPMFMSLLPFQHDRNEFDHKEIRTFVKLGSECFEYIYLGVNIDAKDKIKVIKCAKALNPNIKIIQMVINADKFSLKEMQNNINRLEDYIEQFSNLHTNTTNGKKAPHKAVMLMTVIDMISMNLIKTNKIEYSEYLEEHFKSVWNKSVGYSVIYRAQPGTPFWHLNSEPFWKLVPFEGGDETIANLQKGNPYSSGTIRKYIRYAEIDLELFELLKDFSSRCRLMSILKDFI